jgi:hypothetical protein
VTPNNPINYFIIHFSKALKNSIISVRTRATKNILNKEMRSVEKINTGVSRISGIERNRATLRK